MINIIKHGKETFRVVCPVCGCEFTYQAEDLKADMFGNHYVECPDCKNAVPHDEPKVKGIGDLSWRDRQFYVDYQNPKTTWTNWPDCATCPNRPDPNKPITVGDSPCTFCKKMQPYCTSIGDGTVTVTTGDYTIKSTGITGTGNHTSGLTSTPASYTGNVVGVGVVAPTGATTAKPPKTIRTK